jgi:integrase
VKKGTYGFGSVRKCGEVWYIRYRVNGLQREESARTTDKAKAEALLKQRLADASAGDIDAAPQKVTIADLCELVKADYRLRQLRTLKGVEWKFNAHIKDALGSLKAWRFGPNQVREYVAKRRSEGAENSTINRELSIIRRGFSLGRREQPPLVNAVPYIPMLEEDNARQGFIEEPQYRLLLSVLPDDLKAAFVVAYHCGNRLGEIRKIQPNQLNLEAERDSH